MNKCKYWGFSCTRSLSAAVLLLTVCAAKTVTAVDAAGPSALTDPCRLAVVGSEHNSDHSAYRLRIDGRIQAAAGADYVDVGMAELATLPTARVRTSTAVTDGVSEFVGVYMRDLLDHVHAEGDVISAYALNGYKVDIPMSDTRDFDLVLAWMMDGVPLRADSKGPFWIVYPRDDHSVLQDIRYDYRWVWQLCRLRVR